MPPRLPVTSFRSLSAIPSQTAPLAIPSSSSTSPSSPHPSPHLLPSRKLSTLTGTSAGGQLPSWRRRRASMPECMTERQYGKSVGSPTHSHASLKPDLHDAPWPSAVRRDNSTLPLSPEQARPRTHTACWESRRMPRKVTLRKRITSSQRSGIRTLTRTRPHMKSSWRSRKPMMYVLSGQATR